MNRKTALLTSLLLTLTLLGSAGAVPSTDDVPQRDLHAQTQALADDLLAAVDGDTAAVLLQVAAEGDVRFEPVAADLSDPAGALAAAGIDLDAIPDSLQGPLGRLWIATTTAEDLVAQATASLHDHEVAQLLDEAQQTIGETRSGNDPGQRIAKLVRSEPTVDLATKQVLLDKVDRAKIAAAAHLVLTVIDAELPALQQQADTSGGGGDCSTGPDAYDAPGQLGLDVGSSTAWTNEYVLVVDLSGDDCHFNGAGAAQLGASVVIDVIGNDIYPRFQTSGSLLAQGAASLGVGILVDGAGDDDYSAHAMRPAPQPGPAAPPTTVTAQGAGFLGGVGILIDGGGNDAFRTTARVAGGDADVASQGGARLGGIGLLLSAGGPGSTTLYDSHATSDLHLVSQDDSVSQYTRGVAIVQSQGGASLGGVGAQVDGTGDDSRSATTLGREGRTSAQGGTTGGVGILVDGDGVDTYDARANGELTLDLTVSDTRFCWTVTVNVNTADTITAAQGGADLGAAILVDAGLAADQRFSAVSDSSSTAHAEVANSASTFCTNHARATALTGDARVVAHGAGVLGAGVLLSSDGADGYRTSATSDATATALVNHGGVGTNTASATSGSGNVLGHGSTEVGAGLLVEAGGDDTYARHAATKATETTTTGGTVAGTSGTTDLRTEGWAQTGLGWLLDLGGVDTYATAAAMNDHCWSQPDAPVGETHQGRGRDLSIGTVPTDCP